MLQEFKGAFVAEEEGFIGGDGINDLSFNALAGFCFGLLVQLFVGLAAMLASDRTQACLKEIRFALVKIYSRYVVNVLSNELQFVW